MIYRWKSIVTHSIPLLTICILIEIFAGQILQGNQEYLIIFPLFLISVPVVNSVGGNIGSILGARLASGLHVGYVESSIKDRHMHENVLTAILLGIITYFFLGILIYVIADIAGIAMNVDPVAFIAIILGTGIFLVVSISLISVIAAFFSFKKGIDPDNMVAPIVTTFGDTMGIVFLFVLIGVVGIW